MVLFAKDILEKDFLSLPSDTTALDAAKKMQSSRHGFVIVVDAGGNPEGMVTEWDYLSKIVAAMKDPSKVKLAEIMSVNLVTAKPDDGIDHAAQLMTEQGIRRILVVKDGKVIGVVTARTVVAKLKSYIDSVSSQIARLQTPKL